MKRLTQDEFIQAKQDLNSIKNNLRCSLNRQEQLLDELMEERKITNVYKGRAEELKKMIMYEETYREVENKSK